MTSITYNEALILGITLIFIFAIAMFVLHVHHKQKLEEAKLQFVRNTFDNCVFTECQLRFDNGNALFIEEKDTNWDDELKNLPKETK